MQFQVGSGLWVAAMLPEVLWTIAVKLGCAMREIICLVAAVCCVINFVFLCIAVRQEKFSLLFAANLCQGLRHWCTGDGPVDKPNVLIPRGLVTGVMKFGFLIYLGQGLRHCTQRNCVYWDWQGLRHCTHYRLCHSFSFCYWAQGDGCSWQIVLCSSFSFF